MPDLVGQAIARLKAANVRLDPGLTNAELSQIQRQLGFTFGPEHRELLRSVLPAGEAAWPDWRNGSSEDLRRRLDWPVEGLIFDVHNNSFWPSSWGLRPDDPSELERRARARLADVPRLVPIFAHRYMTTDPAYRPSPVFSVHQADVIYYGDNLLDYIAVEFKAPPRAPSPDHPRVPFWSDLAHGAESQDL